MRPELGPGRWVFFTITGRTGRYVSPTRMFSTILVCRCVGIPSNQVTVADCERAGMFEDDVTVPAGWYPDPMGLPQLRWWNNHAWTELTSEARPPLVMQAPTRLAYADEEMPTRRQQREQRERDEQYAHLATDEGDARDAAAAHAPLTLTLKEIDPPVRAAIAEDAVDDDALDDDAIDDKTTGEDRGRQRVRAYDRPDNFDTIDYDSADSPVSLAPPIAASSTATDRDSFDTLFLQHPAASWPTESAAPDIRSAVPLEDEPQAEGAPRPVYNAPVWLIALVPLVLLVSSLLLLLGFGSSLGMFVTPAIWAGSYVLVVILAIADRFTLKRSGYGRPAHWAWALLTAPVYLVARSMSLARLGRLGFAPLLIWAALGILQVGSVLVVPGLIISALPTTFAMQAESSVVADASSSPMLGPNLDVHCNAALPVIIGQTFRCKVTTEAGVAYRPTVSLQRTNGWIDWHVDDWGVYTLTR